MGYIKHHAIIVTSYDKELINLAHKKAKEIFILSVTNVIRAQTNSEYSFLIGPDGSKEGWPESDAGDKRRDEFLLFAQNQAYEDGSNSLKFCEVFYGEDNGKAKVLTHN